MTRYEKNKRLLHAIEAVKTVLLGLLLVSLILLVIVYIGGTAVYRQAASDKEIGRSFDKLFSVQGGSKSEGLDPGRLIPEFIGYKQAASEPVCSIADADSAAELYDLIKPCLLELFGSDSVCRSLSRAEGERLINRSIRADEFIYLRYHVPVMYQLIYAYASDKLTLSEDNVAVGTDGSVGAYVGELVIVPDTDYAYAAHRFVAYACDMEGNYYEFRPLDHIVTSSFYISKLAGSGKSIAAHTFAFASDGRMPITQPIIDDKLEYEQITTSVTDLKDDALTEPLLRLFGYNPDKLTGYTDETADIYVNANSRLMIEEDQLRFIGSTLSTGKQGGIEISSLLDYSTDDALNLFDKLTAVDNLIRRLGDIAPSLIGGDAALCLGDVYSSGSMLVIEYVLTYNNIRIGSDVFLRATLTQDTVCRVLLTPITVIGKDEFSSSLRQNFVIEKLKAIGSIPLGSELGRMRYVYRENEAAWEILAP